MIRHKMTTKANPAKGCMAKEAEKFPCNSKLIARPNPHPGHQVKPRWSKGHKVK